VTCVPNGSGPNVLDRQNGARLERVVAHFSESEKPIDKILAYKPLQISALKKCLQLETFFYSTNLPQ
jgi:hypothetical protein